MLPANPRKVPSVPLTIPTRSNINVIASLMTKPIKPNVAKKPLLIFSKSGAILAVTERIPSAKAASIPVARSIPVQISPFKPNTVANALPIGVITFKKALPKEVIAAIRLPKVLTRSVKPSSLAQPTKAVLTFVAIPIMNSPSLAIAGDMASSMRSKTCVKPRANKRKDSCHGVKKFAPIRAKEARMLDTAPVKVSFALNAWSPNASFIA